MGHILTRTLTYATGTFNTSGDNTVISGVANNNIVIKSILLQNESSSETTALIKNGATTIMRVVLAAKQFIYLPFDEAEEIMLATNTHFIINLSGANSHGYSIRYFMAN